MAERVLVIAPHMDDETLGMGGTIARHVQNGDTVSVCIMAHRVYDRKRDASAHKREVACTRKAKKVLGYHDLALFDLPDERLDVAVQDMLIPLEKYINKVEPEIVYSCFYGDNHQDHRAVFGAVRVAIRPFARVRVKKWYLYETPSSTEQSPPVPGEVFMPNHYVDISSTIELKISAYHCYEVERRVHPHPRSEEALKALAVKRGAEIGFEHAEAFMLMRDSWGK